MTTGKAPCLSINLAAFEYHAGFFGKGGLGAILRLSLIELVQVVLNLTLYFFLFHDP
jgi:hypothetical protein